MTDPEAVAGGVMAGLSLRRRMMPMVGGGHRRRLVHLTAGRARPRRPLDGEERHRQEGGGERDDETSEGALHGALQITPAGAGRNLIP